MGGLEIVRPDPAMLKSHAGLWLPAACVLHCAVTPLIIAWVPLRWIGAAWEGPLEIVLLMAAIGLAFLNLCRGYRIHRRGWIFLALAIALFCAWMGKFCSREPRDLFWSVLSAIGLSVGYFVNHRLCGYCRKC